MSNVSMSQPSLFGPPSAVDLRAPTSTAGRAAIPVRPATASASSRMTARVVELKESIGAGHEQRRRIQRSDRRASDGRPRNGMSRLHVRADSDLLVKQMRGEYRVKSPGLQPLFEQARALARQIGHVTFEHVRREFNKDADRLANEAMDEAAAG